MNIKHFSNEEKAKIAYFYEDDGLSSNEVSKIFKCSYHLIVNILIKFFGKEKYQKIVKEHLRENARITGMLPRTQKQIEAARKNGQKLGKLLRTPKQIESSRRNAQKVNKLPKTQKQIEACRRNAQKMAHSPRTAIQIEAARKNVQKLHKLPRTLLQIETSRKNGQKLVEWSITHECWVSGYENQFYEQLLKKKFDEQDIKRQYRLSGLNHPFDFAIPKFKFLIEIDGDYWHKQPNSMKRDAEINEFVWRTYPDWIFYRFGDDDLKRFEII